MTTITKQGVKNYVNITNKDLLDKLEENIDNKDNWNDFKTDFISLMEAYVVNPIQSNETKIYNLVSNNFLSNKYVANDVLEKFLKGLGIKNQRDNQSPNDEKYLRELYSSFGLDYDIDEKKREQFEENQYIKFGKKNEGISGFHKNLLSRKAYKNYKTSVKDIVKVKKESENKKSKNKSQNKKVKKIEKTEEKLNIVIEDLKNAKKTIFEKNKNQIDKVDDDVKNAYEYMLTNQNDKEKVVKFEEKILQKENTQKESMKRDIDNIISNKKLYEQFENIFESNFLDLSRKEFMDQVDYIFNNSKIDKDGKLIVPKDSIFRNVIFNENGEIRSGKEDVIDILSTNYELRKVKDLSNKDIEVIAKDFKDNRDESELDEKSKGYAFRKFIVSHPELVSSTYDILVDDLTDNYDKYVVTQDLKQEAEIAHKIILSNDIKGQFSHIRKVVKDYGDKEQSDGSLSKKDNKNRDLALKIAKRKMKALEKAKLSKVVKEGNRDSMAVIDRANGILMPHLENARNKDSKKFEKKFGQPDHEI